MTPALLAAAVAVTVYLPLAVSALCGTVIPMVVDLVTHSRAPSGVKRLLAAGLSALAGALTTVAYTSGERWQDYVLAITIAWVTAIAVHTTGISDPIQRATANIGVGKPAGRHARTDGGHSGVDLMLIAAICAIIVILFLLLLGAHLS